jgi:glutathione peroxidase
MKDKKICIVFNAATGCGNHKKHITQLVELDNKYGSKGLQIIGFPSNEFSQCRHDSREVAESILKEYNAKFPILDKIKVLGGHIHPFWEALVKEAGFADTNWNYYKFLVEPDLNVLAHGDCKKKKPMDFESDIKRALGL